MSQKTVDARGLPCPKPIIIAKKAINEGEPFTELIDNETSKDNVERFLSDNGISFTTIENDGVFSISVSPGGEPLTNTDAETYYGIPSASQKNKTVVCIKSQNMGTGNDELGTLLMKGFVNTLVQMEPLPEKIILYNSGVRLAVGDNPVSGPLKELHSAGVTVLVCGTCADFFEIKDRVAVGTISNMYEIVESLHSASKVIYP